MMGNTAILRDIISRQNEKVLQCYLQECCCSHHVYHEGMVFTIESLSLYLYPFAI